MNWRSTLLLFIGSVGILAVSNTKSAQGFALSSEVIVNNQVIGTLSGVTHTDSVTKDDSIEVFFNTNPDNSSGITLNQLASSLGIDHFNWLQIVTIDPNPPLDSNEHQPTPPYIDLPNGGYDYKWGDDIPWFWNEKIDPNNQACKRPGVFCSTELQRNTSLNFLKFLDNPQEPNIGYQIYFSTFLIADFGNKTYDTLGSFSWSMTSVGLTPNDLRHPEITKITSLRPGATFTAEYAQKIQQEFGYTKVLKLPTYTFDGSLTPGKVDTFKISETADPSKTSEKAVPIPANAPFLTWTDNLPGINPPKKPDTVLRTLDGTGKIQRNYNDDGGPNGQNKASGLVSSVNLDPSKSGGFSLPTNNGTITENKDGIINLQVTGSSDLNFNGLKDGTCDPQPEQGNYKLFVKLYEDSFYPGGGVFSVPNVPSADTDCVKTEIITIPPNLPPGFPPIFPPCSGGSGGSGCSTTSLLANKYSRPSSVPEPTAALGLLALGTWGAVQALKIRKSKQQ